jgi:hypothetical protein
LDNGQCAGLLVRIGMQGIHTKFWLGNLLEEKCPLRNLRRKSEGKLKIYIKEDKLLGWEIYASG